MTQFTNALTQAGVVGVSRVQSKINSSTNLAAKGLQAVQNETKKTTQQLLSAEHAADGFLTQFSQEAIKAINVMKAFGFEVREVQAGINTARSQARQTAISQRSTFDAASRKEIETIRNAGREQFVQSQKNLIQARQAGQRRILITQEVLRTIGRLERAAGAAVSGAARTATSAVSRTFSALTSAVRRDNSALTNGLAGSLRTRESLYSTSFSRQEKILSSSAIRQEKIIRDLQTRTSKGVLGAATGRGVGGGLGILAGGAGALGLLTSGFRRFSDLERINKQFLALTGNIDDTNKLLEQTKQFAKETPFDLVGVADLAKGFLAIKTPVDQVLPRVRAIADAVALTGGGVEELNRIQKALGQIVSTGKLQGDELNQLAENLPGLNIRQILADQLTGGNVPALVQLQEAGKLSAESVVDGLITGLANDPRLQGASGDLAKTLGGRVANLKESFADFGAAIIGTVVGPLKQAVFITQSALQGLADFIRGEDLSSGLLLLRDAVQGVAIGLGAVFAAKGGIEVIKLLTTSLGLLASPLGVVLIAAGLIGAALTVMLKRSEPLRAAFKQLGDRFTEIGRRIKAFFQPALEGASSVVDDRLIPAITRFADFLAAHLIPALDTAATFVVGTLIPGFLDLANIVSRSLGVAFAFVADKVGRFITIVRPFIQPAIDGFRDLGNAIGLAFGGDFSGLQSGAASALSGLGASVVNLATAIGRALLPVAESISNFFLQLFSGPNLKKYLSGVLDFVEALGRTLGTLLSSPLLLKAIAGIAALAAIIAVRFLKGFVEGVLSHLDEIVALGAQLLGAIAKGMIANPLIIAAAVTALFLAPRLLATWRKVGEMSAKQFVTGMGTSLKSSPGFLSGLFGGAGTGAAATKKALQSQLAGVNQQIRALGGTALGFGVKLDAKSIDKAKTKLAELRKGFTDAEIAGRNLRLSIQQNFAAAGGVLSGLGKALSGVGTALAAPFKAAIQGGLFNQFGSTASKGFLQTMSQGLQLGGLKISEGLRAAFTSVQTLAKQQGTSVGKIIGRAVVGGIAVGTAGIGAFLGGQAEGAAGGSGILSVLGSVGAGLATGGALGAAIAGVGSATALLGAAFGKSGAAAKAFKQEVNQLAESLGSTLLDALKNSEVAALNLSSALTLKDVRNSILDSLKPETIALLDKLGLKLGDVFDAFRGGDKGVNALIGLITEKEGILGSAKAVTDLRAAYRGLDKAILDTNNEVRFAGTVMDDTRDRGRDMLGGATSNAAGYEQQIQKVNDKLLESQAVIDATKAKVDDLFNLGGGNALQDTIDSALIAVDGLGPRLAESLAKGTSVGGAELRQGLDQLGGQLSTVINEGIQTGAILTPADAMRITQPILAAATAGVTDPALLNQINTVYGQAISGLQPTIDETKAAQEALKLSTAVQTALDQKKFSTAIEAEVFYKTAKTSDEARRNALFPSDVARQLQIEVQATVKAPSSSDVQSKFTPAGFYAMLGMSKGIDANQFLVTAAAGRAASAAVKIVQQRLGIQSPSKVFMEIGKFIGQGLAEGIADSSNDVNSVVSTAVDAAVNAAIDGADRAQTALKNAGAQLFSALTGSNAPTNFRIASGLAQGGITDAIQNVLSTVASNAQSLFDATSALGAGTATAAQKNVVGESFVSVNPNDVLGSANRSALGSAFDAIAQLGKTLLESGRSAGDVTSVLNDYVNQLVTQAVAAGFNQADVLTLADAFGLSSSALADFVNQLAQLTDEAKKAKEAATANGGLPSVPGFGAPRPTSQYGAPARNFDRFASPINVALSLPYGDPEAVAMAVANRLAAFV